MERLRDSSKSPIQNMETLEQPGTLSVLDKSLFQLRMEVDQLPEGVSRLLASSNEVVVCGEVLVNRPGGRSGYHPAAHFFEPVAEFDILHAIKEELFVEATRLQQELAVSGYVTGVVIRKIHRSARDAVRVKNPAVAQIPKKRIRGVIPRGFNSTNDRGF